MIQAWLLRHWRELAAIALLALACWRGYGWAYDNGATKVQSKWDAQKLADAKSQLEDERRRQKDLAAIAEKYEQDKRDAEEAHRRLVDGLRAGTVRLQDRWNVCVARSAAERDAAARDREESAARIVQAARAADDQIQALQEVIRADRQ